MLFLLGALALAEDPSMETVFAALSSPTTVQTTFTQTQHRAVLARPLESKGRLVFARPDRLRWQIDAPTRAVFVMDGTTFTTAMPDLGITEEISLAAHPEYLGLVHGLTVWLQADADLVAKNYDASWDDGRLVLVPKTDDLSRWVSRFVLSLSEDHRSVTEVELFEADGDRVVLVFSEVRLGADVDAEQFQLK
ncbi:MAG: outer membrane lipoprotein carrier protein LolA [Proteobacteria bacterium]|nr:outer membrane lipoprotein carrier protein LolA [Pseudomonadota bacterium]